MRHAVGEYSEDEWQRINDQSSELLGRLRGELRSVGDEIARLAEVQGLIGGAPKRVEPAPPPPPPPVAVAPEPEPEPERFAPPPAAPVGATRPAPKPAPKEPEITHGPPVDEMAFLKSVAPEEERKPAPAPAPTSGRRGSNPGPSAARSSEGSGTASQTAAPGKPGAAGGAKTLKCGECGTLNRPTEWYCERCGAELAGI